MKKLNIILMFICFLIIIFGCELFEFDQSYQDENSNPLNSGNNSNNKDSSNNSSNNNSSSNNSSSAESVDLSFDFSGAKALAVSEESSSRSSSSDAFGLVKVLDDGSIEPALDLPDNFWLPSIQFIATCPVENNDGTRSVYVSFENNIRMWDDEQKQDVNLGNFWHIKSDGTYDVVMDSDGQVNTWSWGGADDYKPIVFDNSGNLFFNYRTHGSSNTTVLYKYEPDTEKVTPLTAQVEGYEFQNFQIDPSGQRLFVMGQRYMGGSSSNFFRMYPLANMTSPKTIYYSSGSDTWVRGYKIAPTSDYLVMNGWNIRGINGIMKVDIVSDSFLNSATKSVCSIIMKVDIVSDSELTYSPLFDSENSSNFNPEYREEYRDWENTTYYFGFFDRIDRWRVRVLMTDGEEFQYVELATLAYLPTNPIIWYWDNFSQTNSQITIGTDVWFATDENDATVYDDTDLTWNNFTSDTAGNGGSPIYKLEWWYWDSMGEHRVYKDVPSRVIDYITADADYDDMSTAPPVFMWDEHWYTNQSYDSGELDVDAIMKNIESYYVEDILFKYGSDTGEEAFIAALADEPYDMDEIYGPTRDNWYFLNQHVVKSTDTSTAATSFNTFKEENDLGWLNFQEMSNLFFDDSGNLWGVLGGGWWGNYTDPKPVKLLDSEGNKSLSVLDAFKGDDYKPVGFYIDSGYLYFRNAVVDTDGYEIGLHNLYRFKISEENPTIENVLQNVDEDGNMEIIDFSVGNGFLYFTGVYGIEMVGGKVNLSDFEYTAFDSSARIKNIEVY